MPTALKTVIAGSLTFGIGTRCRPSMAISFPLPWSHGPAFGPWATKGRLRCAKEEGFSARAWRSEETHRIAAMMGISGFAFMFCLDRFRRLLHSEQTARRASITRWMASNVGVGELPIGATISHAASPAPATS